nr:hypothetical protein [Hyphomonas sp. Mor2]
MKTQIGSIALAMSLLTACSSETAEVVDPYADLDGETLLVRFEPNPDVEDSMCNPNVHYAMRTPEDYIFLNVNYAVGDNITGSGINLANLEDSGVARTNSELNMFEAYDRPCAELQVKVTSLTCRTAAESDGSPCPSPRYEGTEMFASFQGLPDD